MYTNWTKKQQKKRTFFDKKSDKYENCAKKCYTMGSMSNVSWIVIAKQKFIVVFCFVQQTVTCSKVKNGMAI